MDLNISLQEIRKRAENFILLNEKNKISENSNLKLLEEKYLNKIEEKNLVIKQLEKELYSTVENLMENRRGNSKTGDVSAPVWTSLGMEPEQHKSVVSNVQSLNDSVRLPVGEHVHSGMEQKLRTQVLEENRILHDSIKALNESNNRIKEDRELLIRNNEDLNGKLSFRTDQVGSLFKLLF